MNSNDPNTTKLNLYLKEGSESDHLKIEIFYRGQSFNIGQDNLPFIIGREDESCDLVVKSDLASRKHCCLDRRNGQVIIEDTSTNGTVVKVGRSENVLIKNRFLPINGQGCMKLGEDIKLDDPNLILFKVVST